jgi:hypothetical protein
MSIQKINYNGKTIIHVDFTGLKEQGMIDHVDKVVEILLAENKAQLLLYEYSKSNYATPKYMRHLEEATKKVIPFVGKSVIVAELNLPKRLILRAYNLVFNRDVRAFLTRDEALRYLTGEKS